MWNGLGILRSGWMVRGHYMFLHEEQTVERRETHGFPYEACEE